MCLGIHWAWLTPTPPYSDPVHGIDCDLMGIFISASTEWVSCMNHLYCGFYPGPLSHVINDLQRHKINLLPLWFTNSTNQKKLRLFSNLFPERPAGLLVGWRHKTNGQFRGGLWNGLCVSSLYSLPCHSSSQFLLADLLLPLSLCCVQHTTIFSKSQPSSK